jgi:Protein of unknown function (DUF402)
MNRWKPGDAITVREVWLGKVWTVRPVTIARDERDLIALHMPSGTPWLRPVDASGQPLRLPGGIWQLKEDRLLLANLGLAVPGEPFSVILMWEHDWKLRWWYINLEQPLSRTTIGFDFMDQTLDIVVAPDMTAWRWKDEDELEDAQAKGTYSREQAQAIRAEGERALEWLLARKPPFDERWEDWRPDPSWGRPQIADGWEQAGQT